jgi:hypothetical protein
MESFVLLVKELKVGLGTPQFVVSVQFFVKVNNQVLAIVLYF